MAPLFASPTRIPKRGDVPVTGQMTQMALFRDLPCKARFYQTSLHYDSIRCSNLLAQHDGAEFGGAFVWSMV